MSRSPTKIWCHKCEAFQPCWSLDPTSYFGESGHQFYRTTQKQVGQFEMTVETDLKYFRRARRCSECDETFVTVEINEGFLNELVTLRNVVAAIDTAVDGVDRDAEKLEQSLAILRNLIEGRRNSS